jgi:1-deoxy-D-xylulose-5-phosphate synthase
MTSLFDHNFNLTLLKKSSLTELTQLATQIRQLIHQTCSQRGGHLASNLGTVELTLALHFVFDSPHDQLVFDVGHQSYTHKILTDRLNKFTTLRAQNGLSGFTNPQESPHDANISGHGGNAISVATGLSIADPHHCKIAIVGDGCLLNGLSMEALNHLATTSQNVLIIINDNGYAIDRCQGAIATHQNYQALIESFNLPYFSVTHGHHLPTLIKQLSKLKNFSRPRVLHLKTKKGCGLKQSANHAITTHFYQTPPSQKKIKLQDFVGKSLTHLATHHPSLMLVTPAMKQGGGFHTFAQTHPERFFDVGIAESHALALAAGLAAKGKRPFVHCYASFLQRAYDQIIHDLALPQLPVTLLIDRAGLVGEDGVTHQGTLAFNFLNLIPQLTILSPGDTQELYASFISALTHSRPTAILYPKVNLSNSPIIPPRPPLVKNTYLRYSPTATLTVISTGWLKQEVQAITQTYNFNHFHLPFAKPLPSTTIATLNHCRKILVVEENARLGNLAQTLRFALDNPQITFESLSVADEFTPHAHRDQQLATYHLTRQLITTKIKNLLQNSP